MLKSLAGCDEAELNYFLARIREIVLLGDEAARIETDKFLWEINEAEAEGVFDNELDAVATSPQHEGYGFPTTSTFAHSRFHWHDEQLHYLKENTANKRVTLEDVTVFRSHLLSLRNNYLRDDAEDEDLKQFRSACLLAADEATLVAVDRELSPGTQRSLSNIRSVIRLIQDITQIMEDCSEHFLTDDLKQKARVIKERGARFREGNKLKNAQVAEAAGYYGKAIGLKKEAAALLTQDWSTVFPGEIPPKNTPDM